MLLLWMWRLGLGDAVLKQIDSDQILVLCGLLLFWLKIKCGYYAGIERLDTGWLLTDPV